jgi:hypothetical protein
MIPPGTICDVQQGLLLTYVGPTVELDLVREPEAQISPFILLCLHSVGLSAYSLDDEKP